MQSEYYLSPAHIPTKPESLLCSFVLARGVSVWKPGLKTPSSPEHAALLIGHQRRQQGDRRGLVDELDMASTRTVQSSVTGTLQSPVTGSLPQGPVCGSRSPVRLRCPSQKPSSVRMSCFFSSVKGQQAIRSSRISNPDLKR